MAKKTAPLWTGRTNGHPEWLTPREIVEALGPFDLDPCAPTVRPWPTAARHLTIEDDGFAAPWVGRVWLNPPYGGEEWRWVERLRAHGDGIALIFARTETIGFFSHVWGHADAMLFLQRRISFCDTSGKTVTGGVAPSVFVAYGERNVRALRESGLPGALIGRAEINGPREG